MLTTAHTERLSALLSRNLGKLAGILADPSVLHISVTPSGLVFVTRFGEPTRPEGMTLSATERESIIRLVSTHAGRCTTDAACRLTTILPDGERFQAFVPPAVSAPAFEIRKRPARVYTLEEYLHVGIATQAQADVLTAAVRARNNIVVAGGGGTGKTTLLNALLHQLSHTAEHIVTLEDTPELQVDAPYWLALYTVPGQSTMTELVEDALRCSPSRIIVGEIRTGAALDVLDAWNTGHPGGLLSLHADPGRALQRLESLIRRAVNLATNLSLEEIRSLIADSVNVIVEMTHTPGAPGRRITAIQRCHGLSNGHYTLEDI